MAFHRNINKMKIIESSNRGEIGRKGNLMISVKASIDVNEYESPRVYNAKAGISAALIEIQWRANISRAASLYNK